MDPGAQVLVKEDALRLNVLMTQADAVRIDADGPEVVARAGERELRVALHPQGREDAYLLAVRRLLASLVIGHPGGFPVFIRRWLRGGQLENLRTADLLKLGEPEAVLAAAASPGIDAGVARLAWWAHPDARVARALLDNPALEADDVRAEMAEWLAAHLPFEQDEEAAMATTRLVAAPGLLAPEPRLRLWRRGVQHPACRVGFLQAAAEDLPEQRPARAHPAAAALAAAADEGNAFAIRLQEAFAAPGQTFLAACDDILDEPLHRTIVSPLLNLLGDWCRIDGAPDGTAEDLDRLARQVEACCADAGSDVARLLVSAPALAPEIRALLLLAGSHEALCYPVFARSTASGTLLRDKLAEVLGPLRVAVGRLLGSEPAPRTARRRRRPAATRLSNRG